MAAKRYILYVRTTGPTLRKEAPFPSFKTAADAGLRLAGYGQFHVDCGEYVPSRSEQLLEENFVPRPSASRLLELTQND